MTLRSLGIRVAALMSFPRGTFSLAVMIAILGGMALPVRAQLTLYDDFNSPQIDPSKWLGQDRHLVGFGGLELIRDIDFDMSTLQGRLQLSHRVAGGTFSSTGFTDNRNRLRFINPPPITAVRFDVVVTQLTVPGCSVPGSSPSFVLAQYYGWLFNDGSSTGPGDFTGNIAASVVLRRDSNSVDPPGVLRAFGSLRRCPDRTCVPDAFVSGFDLGTVTLGQTVTLRMSWDRVMRRVAFQKNADDVRFVTYTFNDSQPPSIPFMTLEVGGAAANCTAPPRPITEITAFFDNVFVNP